MVLFLYSDKNCEHQAISCITSLTNKITDDVKIVYYTIGFESFFEFKNLHKVKIEYKPQYPTFHYYKAELSLLTMRLFPNEYYMFSDTDILYSRKFSFESMKSNLSYPLASFGPHEYPYMWQMIGDSMVVYNESKLMQYFNVSNRTQRYVWSCIYTFSEQATDFFEEYTSMCNNKYLLNKRNDYYPMHDETSFNICLWKRGATKNLGFAFLNTHLYDSVKKVEENVIKDQRLGVNIDDQGNDWEYVYDSESIIGYHGFKEKEDMVKTVNYLLTTPTNYQ
jgi:hypothetical protein